MSKKKRKPPAKYVQKQEQTEGKAYGSKMYSNAYSGPCHVGIIDVMELGEAKIWAGKYPDMRDDLDWDLRIRLNDGFVARIGELITADEGAKAILPDSLTSIKYPPTLDIDWEDFSVPPLPKRWWETLVRTIKDMGPVAVSVCCYGGHGRTGTALTILACLSGNVPEGTCPVEWVRKRYCEEAVESYVQISYIQEMTGRVVTSLPTSVLKYQHHGGQGASTFSNGVWHKNNRGVWTTSWDEVVDYIPDDVQAVEAGKDMAEGYKTQMAASIENAAKEPKS